MSSHDMWLGVDMRIDAKKTHISKRLNFIFKTLFTILESIVNTIEKMIFLKHSNSILKKIIAFDIE